MFTPHTDSERQEMLKAIGKKDVAELFSVIPEAFRFPELELPDSLSEWKRCSNSANGRKPTMPAAT
jgi:Glycine cleavage system protein P (pyridoxal-binding), N-terminal domain